MADDLKTTEAPYRCIQCGGSEACRECVMSERWILGERSVEVRAWMRERGI